MHAYHPCTACINFGEVSYESYEAADKVISFSEKCVTKRLTSFKICENGGWSEICDSNFTKSDAIVMCRELGYSDIGVYVKFNDHYNIMKSLAITCRCTDVRISTVHWCIKDVQPVSRVQWQRIKPVQLSSATS